ncbi:uncharacterized protein LOC144007860 isoform X3 [Festucalex cinctus]
MPHGHHVSTPTDISHWQSNVAVHPSVRPVCRLLKGPPRLSIIQTKKQSMTSSPETYLSRKKRDAHSLTSDSIASSSSTCCSTRSCNTLTRIATKSKRRFPEGGNLQIEPKMADLLCVSTWTHKQTSLYQVFLNVSFLSTGSHLQHNGQIDCKNGRML